MAVFQVVCFALFMFYFLNTVQSDSYTKIQITDGIEHPGVFTYNDNYYMVGKNGRRVILKSSRDLLTWKIVSYSLLDDDPKWAKGSIIYSPEIHINPTYGYKKFNLYFHAEDSEKGGYRIGVAQAKTLLGPYRDIGGPLIESKEQYPQIIYKGMCILYSCS